MARFQLVASRDTESPLRLHLKSEIEAHKTRQADITALVGAVESARSSRTDASILLSKAESDLAEAPNKYAEYLAEIACGRKPPPALSIKEAQAAVNEARDAYAAAKQAHEMLEGRLETARSPSKSDTTNLRDAACAVIASELPSAPIFAEVLDLQRKLSDKRLALRWLTTNAWVPCRRPGDTGYERGNPLYEGDIPRSSRSPNDPEWWKELEGNTKYETALNALMSDHTAPVPSF